MCLATAEVAGSMPRSPNSRPRHFRGLRKPTEIQVFPFRYTKLHPLPTFSPVLRFPPFSAALTAEVWQKKLPTLAVHHH